MTWDTAQQFFRIALQHGAGVLVARGVLTEEMATTAIGGLLALGSVAWWLVWNRKRSDA